MRASLATLLVCTITTAAACAKQSSSVASGYDAQVSSGVEKLRAATRSFQTLDSAVASGYARDVPTCFVHEHHGAMGYHHVNRSYMDGVVEVERPEILLYQKMPDGKYQLNGVEFIVPYRTWPRDSVAPTVLGQLMKHEDNLKYWYLHAWVWNRNPDGLFADFHPNVTCPEQGRKVYTPSQ
jgi:hypothetical protein